MSRREPTSKPRRRRRTWPQRFMLMGIILVTTCILLIGGLYAYGNLRFDEIPRTVVRKGVLAKPEVGLPFNILLVGSDSRADFTGKDLTSFGNAEEVKGQRSDTMMLVHVDPRTGGVSVLSIPRDLWVTLADVGTEDRVNQAFDGGPSRLIATIQNALGVKINHYAEVDFVGFRSVVQAVNGVTIWLPYPARDHVTGLDLPNSGCVTLTGDQALAYVRSRHYQELRNGHWRTDPSSDFGRISRQQGFLRYTLRRVKQTGGLTNIDALVRSMIKTVTLDDKFSLKEVTALARRFRGLAPETIRTFVLPTTPDVVDKKDILRLDEARAADVINRFNGFLGTGTLRPDLVQLSVEMAASSSVKATGTSVAARFGAVGFTHVTQGPAAGHLVRTVVRHSPQALDKAQYVAGFLIGGADLVEDATMTGTTVDVQIGDSYAGIRDQPLGFVGPRVVDNDDAAQHRCDGTPDPGLDAPSTTVAKAVSAANASSIGSVVRSSTKRARRSAARSH